MKHTFRICLYRFQTLVTKPQVKICLTVLDTIQSTANTTKSKQPIKSMSIPVQKTSHQTTSQNLSHGSRQNTVNSKHNQVKTANKKHVSVFTFHLFTTDGNIYKHAFCIDSTDVKKMYQVTSICLIHHYDAQRHIFWTLFIFYRRIYHV